MSLLQFFNSLGGGSASPVVANFRAVAFNIYYYNVAAPPTAQFTAIEKHIKRVDGDVVSLFEVNNTLWTWIDANKVSLGYDYALRGISGDFGNCILSKFPITNLQVLSNSFLISAGYAPTGAAEMPLSGTGCFRINLDVNGVNVFVYSLHLEPWCLQTPCDNLERPKVEFPRAVQIYRIMQDMQAMKAANPTAKFIIQGDHNDDDASPQTTSFSSQPSGIRGTFTLGSDIGFPFNYAIYPTTIYANNGITLLTGADLDGDRNTVWADTPNPALTVAVRLDYVATDVIVIGSEVLNSEATQTGGLPKYGNPLQSIACKFDFRVNLCLNVIVDGF